MQARRWRGGGLSEGGREGWLAVQVADCTANRLDWVERCLQAVCGTIACFQVPCVDAVRDGLSAWYWTVSPQLAHRG